MIQNYMLLPFYESKEQQFRFRNNCQQDQELHTFRVPGYSVPSFFFKREKRPSSVDQMWVMDLNDNVVINIAGDHIHNIATADYDGIGYVHEKIQANNHLITSPAPGDLGYEDYILPCGKYYILIAESVTGKTYYSEIFEVVDDEAITDNQELVVNGTFNSNFSNWLIDGPWTISSAKALVTSGVAGDYIKQTVNNANDDDMHFYKVSFDISSFIDLAGVTSYVRVFFNGDSDYMNSVVVKPPVQPFTGSYTFYVKNVSEIVVKIMQGNITFQIDNISVQKVTGHTDHVSMLLSKTCKFPNSIDSANYKYFNYFLLDALIAAPEYGEVLKEDENGDFEKTLSFVRPFKKYQIEPMLLPEPVADALAQLNTFDFVELYDGTKNDIFRLNSADPLTQFRSIQAFETKTEWQGSDCYMLATVSFEENLAVHDKCCDDSEDIIECFDKDDVDSQPVIAAEFDTDHFHISLENDPVGLSAAWVHLYFQKVSIVSYSDCESIGGTSTYSGISVLFTEFEANGIDFYVPDYEDFVYKFFIRVSQITCDTYDSEKVCAPCVDGVYGTIFSADGCWHETDSGFMIVSVYEPYTPWEFIIGACDEYVLEFFDTNGNVWREPDEYAFAGTAPFFLESTVPDTSTLTKIRLNFGSGAYYSNEVTIGHIVACV